METDTSWEGKQRFRIQSQVNLYNYDLDDTGVMHLLTSAVQTNNQFQISSSGIALWKIFSVCPKIQWHIFLFSLELALYVTYKQLQNMLSRSQQMFCGKSCILSQNCTETCKKSGKGECSERKCDLSSINNTHSI